VLWVPTLGDVDLLSQVCVYNGGMKVSCKEEEWFIKELPSKKVVAVGQRFHGGWRFEDSFTGTSAQAYKADSGILLASTIGSSWLRQFDEDEYR
jgi:hypothetical protein